MASAAAPSARSGFLEFSPTRKDDADKENDVPVLTLTLFSKAPFVTFGTVRLGTSRAALLRIENPTEDVDAEVVVDKVPSGKGFSVDQKTFTVEAQGSFSLAITWTPSEEGGVRELLGISANGVLKHQAVLLGRAEAPRKKKKSLWDTIKNKRGGQSSSAQRGKRAEPSLKMAAGRNMQVSREPQYKRDKPRSPLSSLNEGKGCRERSLSKRSSAEGPPQKASRPVHRPPSLLDQENARPARGDPPLVQQNKDLIKILNRTMSPVGTPERFKKLMPHIQPDQSPVLASGPSAAEDPSPVPSVPSLKEALAMISSDLSQVLTSPREGGSSCDLSDSLECKTAGVAVDATPFPCSPELRQTNEPRLTFFVSKKVTSEAAVTEASERNRKISFDSATVTKGKAPVMENCSGGRTMKKSRRRLLEVTLEIPEGAGQRDSGACPPCLPVIDPDAAAEGRRSSEEARGLTPISPVLRADGPPTPVTFPVTSPPPAAPSCFAFSVPSPAALAFPSPSPLGHSSPIHTGLAANRHEPCPTAEPRPAQEEDSSGPLALKSKKRKSEEFLKSDEKAEDGGNAERVKRSRAVGGRARRGGSEQDGRRRSPRQEARTAGTARSLRMSSVKTTRLAAPPQAKHPGAKAAQRGAASVKLSAKAPRVVAVAQSKLTFIKPAQTAIPRHPLPFAAKNMFYDERWIEKQERGFTWWLNYVLTPDDFKVTTEVTKVSAASLAMGVGDTFSIPQAPTKEEMSFSTYTARRKLNRLRRAACHLFTSEGMARAIRRLEQEVEAKRLLIRKDRHLWKDIGERQKVLNWLLSYNPLWLRIGLETIYGEMISLESNSDALGLAVFILQRLLWNPDIAAAFRHPKVPHLYRDGHEEALSRFTLKKLLLLVCFLDRAKEARLIQHDPCLFCRDAEFKTSKDLLLAFSRDFLSGEGILPRHLGYLGLPVSHAQTPLDEFDFAVKNLASDLKCGIRLVRVMELLIQQWGLSAKIRLPAISRLQKIHNVDLTFQVLRSKGVDLKDEHGSVIDSRDIVDGHREKTLNLLWKIIFAFQVEVILDGEQLREEIGFLRRTLRTKRKLVSLRADGRPQPGAAKARAPCEHPSPKIALLMDWVQAVCDFYNLKVDNFTVSFSDGRVLCHLIHHYHPGLLPEEAVSLCTTQTVECSPRGRLELDRSASDCDSSSDSSPPRAIGSPSVEFKELLENERSNFRLVNSAVAFLGGVPAMINPADMSNTIPSEKVVMSFLTFLCARLLDLRDETRAARVIQEAWRRYRLRKDLALYQVRNTAALKIQALVKDFLRRRRLERQDRASLKIQAVWRGFAARRRLRLEKEAGLRAERHRAAAVIQAQWRMFSAARAYRRLRYHAVVVQAQWRMRRAASAFGKIRRAVTAIQARWRTRALARRERESFVRLRTAAVKIQRAFRGRRARRAEKENAAARVIQANFRRWFGERAARRAAAAVRIQSWYRAQRCLRQYRAVRRCAVFIQARCRGRLQRQRFQELRRRHAAAIVVQSTFRGHAVRKQLENLTRASVLIQRWFRACLRRDAERQRFVRLCGAARSVQAAYRGKVARDSLRKQQQAATLIQAAFRRHVARRSFLVLKNAATAIQRTRRAAILARRTRKEYEDLRRAAITVQALWRGRAARRTVEEYRRCATLIVACFRRHKAQAEYRSKRAAALVIQRHYRAHRAGRDTRAEYLRIRAACVTVQAGFRGTRARAELREKHRAATLIQSSVRAFLHRKKYVLLQSAAIVVQSRYRALRLRRARRQTYRRQREAAQRIQGLYRGFRVREEMKRRRAAATAIQAQFRMHRARVAFLATKCAAIIVQERYRAKALGAGQMQRYRAMKAAAVVIQAAYRGRRTRMKMAKRHRAAAVIQRQFRAFRERNRFLTVKAAALVCQRWYRSVTLTREVRLDFLLKRRAVICLQAACRGSKVRKQLRVEQRAAVTIQSGFRMYRQKTYYARLRRAAAAVQARYRANKMMRQETEALRAKKRAAVVLQAAFRGTKSRQIHKQKHRAATCIQRAFRARAERRVFLALKTSVLTVQQKYRATAAAKKQRREYLRLRHAAVVLQAAFRGQHDRKLIARRHRAAAVIQAAFRRHRHEVKFQAMRVGAIIIQRFLRACILQRQQRQHFLKLKHSAVVLQAAYRGRRARRGIARMHRAAAVIQAHFNKHRRRSAFRKQLWAARVLQQRFRAQRQRNLEMRRYQECRRAAVVLQAAFRGMTARQKVKQSHNAATTIQRAYRARCQRQHYLALKSAALHIQRRYRAKVAAEDQRSRYLQMLKAAVILQAAYRGRRVRREVGGLNQAATLIQATFRGHRDRVRFQATRLSAMVIQRSYRACLLQRREQQRFLELRHAALVLQAAYRGRRARRRIARMHWAAAVIQAHFKKRKQRLAFRKQLWAACVLQQRFRAQRQRNLEVRRYQECRRAAVVLQAACRGMTARRSVKGRRQAVCVIQRAYRARCERKHFLTLRSSVLTIQQQYRATSAAKMQRKTYLEVRRAALVFQAAYRGLRARRQVSEWHRAATLIQTAFRRHSEHVKVRATHRSAVVIQRRYRAWILQRQERHRFLRLRRSAVVLQATFRGLRVRRDMRRRRHAATLIQSCWRGSLQRRHFLRKKEAVVKLQRRRRAARLARAERSRYALVREAAVTLQTHCRAWISKRKALEAAGAERRLRFAAATFHHLSAVKIQRALRVHWALRAAKRQIHCVVTIQRWVRAKLQRRLYLEDRRKVVAAQRAARRWLARRHQAASVIQAAARRFLLLRRQQRVESGVVKVQALWRGHRSRRRHDNPRVVKLRNNLRRVCADAREEDKLCNKTASALDYLLKYKQFSYILEALKNLETATRLSPVCCEHLVESGATNIIFTLVRCCNRSVPCMEVITFSIQILLNLSKYHKTIEAVYGVKNSVETLVDLLQRYREKAGDKVAEKGGSIFTKACFLLALLLQDKQRAAEVMELPKVSDRVRSIYRLTAHKHKMDAERNVTKLKMNASVNGSFYVQPTPRKSRPPAKFAPDWVLRKDKLKDVVDPLRAIQMLAETLAVVL